jgi:hypothetical protein
MKVEYCGPREVRAPKFQDLNPGDTFRYPAGGPRLTWWWRVTLRHPAWTFVGARLPAERSMETVMQPACRRGLSIPQTLAKSLSRLP